MKKFILLVFLVSLMSVVPAEATKLRGVPQEEFSAVVKGTSSAKTRSPEGKIGGEFIAWKLRVAVNLEAIRDEPEVWVVCEDGTSRREATEVKKPKERMATKIKKITVSINDEMFFSKKYFKDIKIIDFEEYHALEAGDDVKVTFFYVGRDGKDHSKVIKTTAERYM